MTLMRASYNINNKNIRLLTIAWSLCWKEKKYKIVREGAKPGLASKCLVSMTTCVKIQLRQCVVFVNV